MDTPDITKIKTMPKKDLEALNRELGRKLATRVVGTIFLKLTVSGLLQVFAKKALIEAAKRA